MAATPLSCPLTILMALALPMASWAAPTTPYTHSGQCLLFKQLDQVNYQKFSGKWVEVSARPNIFLDHRMCVEVEFSVQNDVVVAVRTGVTTKGDKRSVTTTLHPQGNQSPFLEVRYGGSMTTHKTIVNTDYTSFACLYQCRQVSQDEKVEWGFALSRDLKEASLAKQKCKKAFETSGFNVQTLMPTVHASEFCNKNITESFPIRTP